MRLHRNFAVAICGGEAAGAGGIVGEELCAFCGGVNAVVLNGAGDGVDVRVEFRQKRHVEF